VNPAASPARRARVGRSPGSRARLHTTVISGRYTETGTWLQLRVPEVHVALFEPYRITLDKDDVDENASLSMPEGDEAETRSDMEDPDAL